MIDIPSTALLVWVIGIPIVAFAGSAIWGTDGDNLARALLAALGWPIVVLLGALAVPLLAFLGAPVFLGTLLRARRRRRRRRLEIPKAVARGGRQ